MLSLFWKSILAVLFPGGLIFLLAIGFLRPQGLPIWLQQPIAALPYIVFTFGLIFGWYFASSRMILSLLVLALADRAMVLFPSTDVEQAALGQTIVAITAFLVPLNLLAFSIFKEDSLTTLRGLTRILLVLVQPFLLIWLCLPDQHDLASSFTREYVPSLYTEWTPIPQPALFAFATALLLHFIRFALRRDPLEGGAIWALVAIFVAYHTSRYGWQPTNFFMAGGLILFVTLFQSFYQQTYRDELTGIPGRLAYEEAIGQLGKRFSVAVISIDQLTQYANIHGKSVSQQILKLVAPRVHAACSGGQIFRTTGEELTVLFPGKSTTESMSTLETVRKTTEAINLILRGPDRVWQKERVTQKTGSRDRALPITLSIGVAEKVSDSATLTLVIKSAYRALYEAKGAGGNVVKRGGAAIEPVRRSHAGSGRVVTSGEYGT
ncbi:MAG TPA: GGDEF domain-containing protein [Nitrospiraceae bacterium]|nr:GGDEF domain-containing protein [Nitrospiraceae bacterium]